MALFQMRWLRKFIRRHMSPIPQSSAAVWKNRLSLAYMLLAWNAFGIVCYAVYKGKANWADYHGLTKDERTPAQQWSETLGIQDATVYRISGFNVHKYQVHNEVPERRSLFEYSDSKASTNEESQADGEMLNN